MAKRKKDENMDDLPDDMPTSIDPYKVLGINSNANEDEVKKAYRKAALKHHPGRSDQSISPTAESNSQS